MHYTENCPDGDRGATLTGAPTDTPLHLAVRICSSAVLNAPAQSLPDEEAMTLVRREMQAIADEVCAGLCRGRKSVDRQRGYNEVAVFDSHLNEGSAYVFKRMPDVAAAKVHFVSTLASLLGIRTPLVIAVRIAPREGYPVASGTLQRYLQGYEHERHSDLSVLGPTALHYLLMTRWFNEIVGNLHCWWGQVLMRASCGSKIDDVVMIDFDDAFSSVGPQFLQRALTDHFGIQGVGLDDCRWLDREFDIQAPITWAPGNYDSPYTIYGEIWRDFLAGRIDLDLGAAAKAASCAQALAREVLKLAMDDYLDASEQYFRNPWVFLPAARNPKLRAEEFRALFHARVRCSADQFLRLLSVMADARQQPHSRIARFYAKAQRRKY